jgi:hypothetical protein
MASKKTMIVGTSIRSAMTGSQNTGVGTGTLTKVPEAARISPTKEFIEEIGVALYNAEQVLIEHVNRLAPISLMDSRDAVGGNEEPSRAMTPIEQDLEHLLCRVKNITERLSDATAMLRI